MTVPAQARRPWGLRIQHPDARFRGALLEIPHPDRTILDPVLGARRPKVYPLRLDGEGCAIVSETVWRRIGECQAQVNGEHFLLRFVVLNEVLNPPTQMCSTRTEQRPTFLAGPSGPAQVRPSLIPHITHKDR